MAKKELSIRLIVDESHVNIAASFSNLILSPEELNGKFFERPEPVVVDIAEMADGDYNTELNMAMAFAFMIISKDAEQEESE